MRPTGRKATHEPIDASTGRNRLSRPLLRILTIAAVLVGGVHIPAHAQERVPEGFEVTTFAAGFEGPLALAVAPDGRVFVGEKGGRIWAVAEAGAERVLFAEIEVFNVSECGLLGLAIDGSYVYAFATISPDEQAILRFTDDNGVSRVPITIRDGLPTAGQNHNGGGLRIGPDRKLYFSIGDNGDRELSQQMNTLAGKLCRIGLDGAIPADNPFTTPTGTPRAIYALGLRNPFRFCFDADGRPLVMDVGSSGDGRREEINVMPAGSNGGWPLVEGPGVAEVAEGTLVQPLVAYHDEGAAIGGCVLYDAEAFPQEYRDGVFHLDYVSRKIFHLSRNADGTASHAEFAETESSPVDLALSANGALLYTELFTGNVKQIRFLAAPVDAPDSDPPQPPMDEGPPCGLGAFGAALACSCLLAALRLAPCAVARGTNRPVSGPRCWRAR